MKLAGMVLATVFAAGSLQAATLDFAGYAIGNEGGVTDGETINFDGVDVTFNAENGSAYFDDYSGGRPAGLGVCTELDGNNQCDPSSDDNITVSEAVTLSFDGAYDLSGLSFNDAGHYSLDTNFTDTLLIAINGEAAVQYTFGAAAVAVFEDISSIMFDYDDNGNSPNEFYVAGATLSPVPLPAAGWLLIGGLGGLAAMKRRKKAA